MKNRKRLLRRKGGPYDIHIAIFDAAMVNVTLARTFITSALPPDIVDLLDWDKMERETDTFTTYRGREVQADAIFKVPPKVENTDDDFLYLPVTLQMYYDRAFMRKVRHHGHLIYDSQRHPHIALPIIYYCEKKK